MYLSPWDRHEPRYSNSAEYDKYYAAELDELAQGYGDLEEFWLDGAGSEGHVYNFPHIIEELRTYQPNSLVFADVGLFEYGDIRWVGNEDGNHSVRELERDRPPRIFAMASRRSRTLRCARVTGSGTRMMSRASRACRNLSPPTNKPSVTADNWCSELLRIGVGCCRKPTCSD